MSELPKGWVKTTVADVTLPYDTDDPTRTPTKSIVYIDIGSIDNQIQVISTPKHILGRDAPSRARRIVAAGDVLFSTVRTYLKNIAVVPDELHGQYTSTGIAVLRPNKAVESRYLFNYVRSNNFITEISKAQDGTLYPAVKEKDVSDATIPLAPLLEQKRIVRKLDKLNYRTLYAREQLNHIPRLITLYKQHILSSAFGGGLTIAWREQVGNESKWKNTTLGKLVTNIVAGKNLRCEERPPREDEKGVVKVSAVTWGSFDPQETKTLPSSFIPPEKTRIAEGDLLISRANTQELVGAVVIVKNSPSNLYLSDKVLRLEVKDEYKSWILWFLRSPQGRAAIEAIASGNQQSMRNISQRNLLEISMPWPRKDEREEIIRRIEANLTWLDRITNEFTAVVNMLPKLDEAIITKAFCGKLVSQNPSDEPASLLLKRVKSNLSKKPKRNQSYKQKEKNKEESMVSEKKLEDVLVAAKDWLSAKSAFQRCGIDNGSTTEEIEKIYAELRDLDKSGKLEVQTVKDEQGRKVYDRIKLKAV
ncbi:restriction endonuclease subunit S [Klebsiella oxytoca]|uniref:restriction endonuclease subunit S n=1 Tax=Klebsiella oxytoca TaxID=571 RepID=UPI002860B5FC|nr:restriction endonuclease subunit S [Escherichia coli]